MIGWLQGQLADRWHLNNRFGVLLVCSGVGYEVQMPRRHWDQLGGNGTETSLHVHQVIREDSWTLYGFCARHERDLFRELVAVSGVGPQMALGLLGQLSCEELVRAIVQADLRQLCQAPGVGKRTAERLSVELRTRLQARYGESLHLSAADDLQTGEAGDGVSVAAHGNAEGGQFPCGPREVGGHGIDAEVATINHAGADGEDILQGAAEFDTDDVL